MTITVSDLQREAKIQNLKNSIVQNAGQRDNYTKMIGQHLAELAVLLDKDVCGEALVPKVPA
jgi:hypothetical protein